MMMAAREIEIFEHTKVLKIVAYLLSYPDKEWQQDFKAYKLAARELESDQQKHVLEDFFAYVEETGSEEFEEQYVRSFEFSQNTNLYLTMQERTDFGKQASEMQTLKGLFLENGFDVTKELPDYLPAILELTAALPPQAALKVLKTIQPKLELIRSRLMEAKLPQVFLLDVVLTEMAGLEAMA